MVDHDRLPGPVEDEAPPRRGELARVPRAHTLLGHDDRDQAAAPFAFGALEERADALLLALPPPREDPGCPVLLGVRLERGDEGVAAMLQEHRRGEGAIALEETSQTAAGLEQGDVCVQEEAVDGAVRERDVLVENARSGGHGDPPRCGDRGRYACPPSSEVRRGTGFAWPRRSVVLLEGVRPSRHVSARLR